MDTGKLEPADRLMPLAQNAETAARAMMVK
jgi:hypothetical protein